MNMEIDPADNTVFKILVVDDDEDVLDAMQLILKNANQFKSEITAVLDGKSAIAEIKRKEYDLVLSDYKLPGMNGIDLLAWVKKRYPNTGRILITGYPSMDVAKDAINKANVHYYIEKPWDNDEFRLKIYETLKKEPAIGIKKMSNLNVDESSFDKVPKREPEKDSMFDNIDPPLKRESEKNSIFDNLDPPPKGENERELEDVIGVNNAKDALRMLDGFEKNIHTGARNPSKQTFIFEFVSISEFNNFSVEIEKRENARIKDIRVFENRYIISVSVYPSTFHFVT